MLNKLNNKLTDLINEINNMEVDPNENVYNKLCDVESDLNAFQTKIEELQGWVNAGIKFLRD